MAARRRQGIPTHTGLWGTRLLALLNRFRPLGTRLLAVLSGGRPLGGAPEAPRGSGAKRLGFTCARCARTSKRSNVQTEVGTGEARAE